MKRLILSAFLLLFAFDAHAIIIIGGTDGGGEPPAESCTTQSVDVSLTTNNISSSFGTTNERGQSWKSGVTGKLYSITIKKNDAGTNATTLSSRVGTSNDLSGSYLSAFTNNVSSGSGDKELVIPEADRPNLVSGATYYWIAQNTGSYAFDIGRDSTAEYSDGNAYYDTSEDWVGTSATSDLYFVVKVCD